MTRMKKSPSVKSVLSVVTYFATDNLNITGDWYYRSTRREAEILEENRARLCILRVLLLKTV